jgi:hypothetical protein
MREQVPRLQEARGQKYRLTILNGKLAHSMSLVQLMPEAPYTNKRGSLRSPNPQDALLHDNDTSRSIFPATAETATVSGPVQPGCSAAVSLRTPAVPLAALVAPVTLRSSGVEHISVFTGMVGRDTIETRGLVRGQLVEMHIAQIDVAQDVVLSSVAFSRGRHDLL